LLVLLDLVLRAGMDFSLMGLPEPLLLRGLCKMNLPAEVAFMERPLPALPDCALEGCMWFLRI